MSLRSTGAALVCFRKADSTRKRAVCLLALHESAHESARIRKRRRREWWSRKLMARVPVLTSSNGVIGAPPILYGRASNYTLDHERPLSPKHYYSMFRFCRDDIPRLVRALRVPAEMTTRNRTRIDGEEALLIFLHRMRYPNRLCDEKMFFGRPVGAISEIAEMMRVYLDDIAANLLLEFDHERLMPLMPVFAAAVHAKGAPLENIWGFVDGTFRWFCRPSIGGYRGEAQRAQYSGHARGHGNNHQGVETPDGILVEMHGPHAGRHNDLRSLRESRLLERLFRYAINRYPHRDGRLRVWALFGDRGYNHGHPCLQVPYKGAAAQPDHARRYNHRMAAIREPVEWSFGKVAVLFAFVDFEKNQKLFLQPVASYWRIATLLTNCHSCLYGNQTSKYFLVPTPPLEVYLRNGFD